MRYALLLKKLLPDTECLNKVTILADVFLLQIIEQASPLTNQFKEALTGVMILFMGLKVISKILNSISNKCNLHL